MKKQYIILSATTQTELSTRVSEYLDRGWELQGGPICSFDSSGHIYLLVLQALVYTPKS